VEPLMRAWGFHEVRRTAPSAAEIAGAQEAVATAVIVLDSDRARLPNAHTRLDFGGIGVGYGIDRALAVLQSRGIGRALVNVSGDIGALGTPPGAQGWLVVIPDPDRPHTSVTTHVHDAALATSANTESLRRYGTLIVGHVMDPATGWPAHGLRQASVVTRTAVEADALSTAMLVSGRRPSGALAVYPVVLAR
jgi:thiamine biosynthesis lipoprotein